MVTKPRKLQANGKYQLSFLFFFCSIVDLQCYLVFALQQGESVIHIYTHSFLDYFLIYVITKI